MLLALLLSFSLIADTSAPDDFSQLTEIGRIKAVTPACAVMRDVTIPAFRAALNADHWMTVATPVLLEYTRILASSHKYGDGWMDGGARKWRQHQLGQASTNMLVNTVAISDALGSSKMTPANTDPDVQAQRAALQILYDDEHERAVSLWRFQFLRAIDTSPGGDGDANAFAPRDTMNTLASRPLPTPVPTALPTVAGLPSGNGNLPADTAAMRAATLARTSAGRRAEEAAAKFLFPIAERCRLPNR